MDPSTFYGKKSGVLQRYRYLSDATEDVASTSHKNLDIVILPPEAGNRNIQSDDEDIDENDLDTRAMPSDVAGELEIHVAEYSDSESSDVEEEPLPIRSRTLDLPKWKKTDNVFLNTEPSKPDKVGSEHMLKTEYEIFNLFFTPEMVESIVIQTNLYANRDKNNPNFKTTDQEIRQFLGLLLVSGYHNLPGEKDYWSTSEDLQAPIFSKTMSRDAFQTIKRYFHLADNNNLSATKVAKVEPLYESLRQNFQQFGVFHQTLSIDEQMIPYHGHHSSKMFIRNKPIRFGFKLWALCSSDGYPYNFDIYCGKKNGEVDTRPLGYQVVDKMLSIIQEPSLHVVYFDNFFTNYQLLSDLADRGIRACGTVRENRIKYPLLPAREMKKKGRGAYDFRSDGKVACVRWNDNSIVTLASNHHRVTPIQKCKRRVKKENNKELPQPLMIKKYNQGMGGVDLLDRMLSSYRPRLRSKRWWWNLFANGLNMAIVGAFRFYTYLHPEQKVTHLSFRRSVAMCLLKVQMVSRNRLGGPTAPVVQDIRYDKVNHFLISTKQGRCVVCGNNTRLKCEKCEKRLHKSFCSEAYHKK